jgi:hypothetical protein
LERNEILCLLPSYGTKDLESSMALLLMGIAGPLGSTPSLTLDLFWLDFKVWYQLG